MNRQRTSVSEIKTARDVVDQMAELRADDLFFIDPDTKCVLSFQEFRQRTINISYRVLDLGLLKGNTVALLLDNRLFSVELISGAMYGGFVPIPLNLTAGRSPVACALNHYEEGLPTLKERICRLLTSLMLMVMCTKEIANSLTILSHPTPGNKRSLSAGTLTPPAYGCTD